METIFIAFVEKKGIACASNSKNTIQQISSCQPIAIAIDSESSIPWSDIVDSFKKNKQYDTEEDFFKVINNFKTHLLSADISKILKGKGIQQCEEKVLFLGYGKDNTYPHYSDIVYTYQDNTAKIDPLSVYSDVQFKKAILSLGKISKITRIINSSMDKVLDDFNKKHKTFFEKFKESIKKEMNGVMQTSNILESIEKCTAEDLHKANYAKTKYFNALCQLSIGELCSAAETLVNAELRLSRLENNTENYESTDANEIIAITRIDGVFSLK